MRTKQLEQSDFSKRVASIPFVVRIWPNSFDGQSKIFDRVQRSRNNAENINSFSCQKNRSKIIKCFHTRSSLYPRYGNWTNRNAETLKKYDRSLRSVLWNPWKETLRTINNSSVVTIASPVRTQKGKRIRPEEIRSRARRSFSSNATTDFS